jgi:hypothetical protein
MRIYTAIFLLLMLVVRSPLAANLEMSPGDFEQTLSMQELNQHRAELLSSLPEVRATGDAEEVNRTIQEIVRIENEMQALQKPIRINNSSPQASLESDERTPVVRREAWDVFKEF